MGRIPKPSEGLDVSLPQPLDAPLAGFSRRSRATDLLRPGPVAGVAARRLEEHIVAAADRVPRGLGAGSEPGALVTVLLHPLSFRNEFGDGSGRVLSQLGADAPAHGGVPSSQQAKPSMRQSAAHGERSALPLPAAVLEGGHDEGPGHCNARSARGPGRRRGMGCNPDRPRHLRRPSPPRIRRRRWPPHHHRPSSAAPTPAETESRRPDIGGHRPRRDLDHARGRRDG